MVSTNFHLAPPVKSVDGLVAVPIDIQKITAGLTFDGATSSAQADATIEFTMGSVNGNPVFDLRQTVTEAWLDGAPFSVANLAHHDFGGGAQGQLRIVESVLSAGSIHALRVKYDLGIPQASTAGSYQPAVTWSAGPRLVFNFGFTDLGAGRYLEAWVPANLIFDQFELLMTLQLLGTPLGHSVITNGEAVALAPNHWSVKFPQRFTALSPLVEVRASDTVATLADTTVLPVSGKAVTVEAWKLVTSAVNLATEVNSIKTFLANDENSTGPYLHGNRFVAFLNIGGMEYEGGTTTGTGALRHETFHSWWARGLKPASQPDAWWDEAWTVYSDNGAIGSFPFNFSNSPVELCPRNPWVRVTAPGAYTDGNRFFEGVAAMIGVANLRSLMSDFYKERNPIPVTTAELEEFLVCRTGSAQLVDAFHRFVYGFDNPSPAPDLWLRDAPSDTGAEPSSGAFWNSPDLWIRNADDGGTTHQAPEYGQDNWFYARVRNRSASARARHFLVTFNVRTFAGTEFQYPGDFLPCVAAAAGFELQPGASAILKARWPAALVPPPGTHACLLSSVLTRFDQPVAGRHVWDSNNLAQKNLTIVNLVPGAWILVPFLVRNLKTLIVRRFLLEVIRPADRTDLLASLVHRTDAPFKRRATLAIQAVSLAPRLPTADEAGMVDCGAAHPPPVMDAPASEDFETVLTSATFERAMAARRLDKAFEVPFAPGRASRIPIVLGPSDQLLFGLRIGVPEDAKPGATIHLDLAKRDQTGKRILGGFAVEIHVVAP